MNVKYDKYRSKQNSEVVENKYRKIKFSSQGTNNDYKYGPKSNNNNIHYINNSNTQKSKKMLTNHIKIDLSKYNINSKKEPNNNIRCTRTTTAKDSKKESKCRYINRSTRQIDEKNHKIIYKKVYINLNKAKNDNGNIVTTNYSNIHNELSGNEYKTINNYDRDIIYIKKDNKKKESKNNSVIITKKTSSKILPKNIVFNNKLNYEKNKTNYETVKKDENNPNKNERKIENIYLNIHNNNVIKNNNNILIKQNEINSKKNIEENHGDKNTRINNNYISLYIHNIKKDEEDIIDDDDIQQKFCYNKNSKEDEEIQDENIFPEDTDNNINYFRDYLKKEEKKLDINNNITDIKDNENILKNKGKEKEKNNTVVDPSLNWNRNKNNKNEIGGSSSTNITAKIKEYNNYYGLNNSKEIIRESTNIKNEKQFQNLVPKTSFQKFLASKLKYYMNEDQIPKKYITEFIVKKYRNKRNLDINSSDLNNLQQQKDIEIDLNKIKNYYEDQNIITEIKRSKSKMKKNIQNENIILEDENKKLMSTINQLKDYIDNTKEEMMKRENELKDYLNSFERINTENEENKRRIENLENQLKSKKYEIEEKKNEIYELSNINYNLENEMKKLKEEYMTEAINNRETNENYSIIKKNYYDIKNQYDLLNIKYKTLSDENFNYKRDKMLYEKELKSKNIIIDDLIYNNKKKEIKGQLNKLELNNIDDEEIKKFLINNKKEKKEKEQISKEQKYNEEENNNKTEKFFEKLNIEELMDRRDELIGERNYLTNEFYKIPTKANMKQNQKRIECEQRISQINNELAKIRIRINILKESKKKLN